MKFRKLIVAVFVFLIGPLAAADEPGQTEERANLEDLTRTIEAFTITVDSDSVEQLEFGKAPVLRYSDAITGNNSATIPVGAVFVWGRNGRPEVVSAIHPSRNERLWIEFLSLRPNRLTATRDGQVHWTPSTAGVEFKPLRDVPAPAPTSPQRLAQMRAILREFSASISDASSGRQELRPLSKPIVRYSDPDRGIVDGAIFVFARSTNPEMLVVLESHMTGGEQHWMYSPAQFTGRAGELRHSDKLVWSHDKMAGERDPASPFFQMYVQPESPPDGE